MPGMMTAWTDDPNRMLEMYAPQTGYAQPRGPVQEYPALRIYEFQQRLDELLKQCENEVFLTSMQKEESIKRLVSLIEEEKTSRFGELGNRELDI